MGNAQLDVRTQLPEGPVRPIVLLPVLQDLSNAMSHLAVESEKHLGAQLSCREGRGACCRQAVPITPVEARALAEWLDALPEGRQKVVRARFRGAARRLEESGVARRVRELAPDCGREAAHELGLRYFALGIACPFLEEERCTIHEMLPLRCREYRVYSPAEKCAHPEAKGITGIKPPVLLSRILARWDTNGDAHSSELILLTMLEEWATRHWAEGDRLHRTAPEMLQEFQRGFAGDASAVPADPRTRELPNLLPERRET